MTSTTFINEIGPTACCLRVRTSGQKVRTLAAASLLLCMVKCESGQLFKMFLRFFCFYLLTKSSSWFSYAFEVSRISPVEITASVSAHLIILHVPVCNVRTWLLQIPWCTFLKNLPLLRLFGAYLIAIAQSELNHWFKVIAPFWKIGIVEHKPKSLWKIWIQF